MAVSKDKLEIIYKKIIKAQNDLYLKEHSVKRLIPTGKIVTINNGKVAGGGVENSIMSTKYTRDFTDYKSTNTFKNNEFIDE
jgi:hypothetical protein